MTVVYDGFVLRFCSISNDCARDNVCEKGVCVCVCVYTWICSGVHWSRLTDLTLEMWTPRLRWIPAQRMHMNTPRFHDAHRGPGVGKRESLLQSCFAPNKSAVGQTFTSNSYPSAMETQIQIQMKTTGILKKDPSAPEGRTEPKLLKRTADCRSVSCVGRSPSGRKVVESKSVFRFINRLSKSTRVPISFNVKAGAFAFVLSRNDDRIKYLYNAQKSLWLLYIFRVPKIPAAWHLRRDGRGALLGEQTRRRREEDFIYSW